MTVDPLLPVESGRAEHALVASVAEALTYEIPNRWLWDSYRCPTALLPWLAYGVSVDEWDSSWSEVAQRDYIAASISIHRKSGTLWAVKRKLAVLGYGAAIVTEYAATPKIGHAPVIGADWRIGWAGMQWADYIVELTRPVTRYEADRLERHLASVAPARCRLWKIIIGRGVNYVIGDELWSIGPAMTIGGVYEYEVQNA